MTTPYVVQPIAMDRPIATITLSGKRVEIYPTAEFVRAFNGMLQRVGGASTDLVDLALTTAQQAVAVVQATAAAAVEAYDAGDPPSYALSPANPIASANISATQALVTIAAHTRTPRGSAPIALNAGTVTIDRGAPCTVYYVDPTDAGGAVAYLATTDPTVAADYAAGARIVGAAYAAPFTPTLGRASGSYASL